jgi:predicted 3-demethylubiquinone-9 3-methyltransferase (glyoxalase superfamily)
VADLKTTVTPFLMFTGQAEEAMLFYTALLPGGEIVSLDRYGAGEKGVESSVRRASFRIAGQLLTCIDSPAQHAFNFTPSFSLFVECAREEEINMLFAALLDGGQALMPLGNYGFSRKFGWLNDRFGVSWQLNFA